MVEQAFDKIDTKKSGAIGSKDLEGVYNVKQHPKVLTGEWTPKQAIDEFVKTFEGDHGDRKAAITKQEWLDYHCGLSSSIDSDDAFCNRMASNWGIKFVPHEKLRVIFQVSER